jgi:hypothetical protein
MIDLLTVNYRNYDLLNLQLDHLSRLDGIDKCRLIVVENTPKNERRRINHDLISEIIVLNPKHSFDGLSHGGALDEGMKYVKSEFVYIFDTDYFLLKKDFFITFINEMKTNQYDAIGPEFFDGRDWFPFRQRFPDSFDGLVTAWGTIFKTELVNQDTWIVTPKELSTNSETGFVDVGWRHRKKLIERGKKTLVFEGYQKNYVGQGNCYFRHNGEDIAFHYMRASYDRMKQSVEEIKSILI